MFPDRGLRGWRIPGWWWWLLFVALPASLVALLLPVNRYRDALGLEALDCDGPGNVLMLALPALALAAVALLGIVLRWRRGPQVAAALLCIASLAAASMATAHAVSEERRQAPACAAR